MTITEGDVPAAGEMATRRTFLNPAYDIEREPLETRRTSQWYAKPYRRRISEYESLLLYAQSAPDWIPGALGTGGFCNKFSGGRAAWENYTTEAKSSDWFVFRDPSGRGQPTYVAQKAEENEEAGRMFAAYAEQGMYRDLDREWTFDVVATGLGAFAHHEYGLFGALVGAPARDVFTDVLRQAVITGAIDHLDNAEMIQAEKVFLSKNVDGFSEDVAPAREFWLSDPVYRTARGIVERLWGEVYDHIEIIFATFMVHEPLFGRFARQQFFHRLAPMHGDQLTPAIMWPTITAAQIDAKWAFELFGHALGQDPKFGEHNRALMRLWARDWMLQSVAAMAEFAPMFSRTSTLRSQASSETVNEAASIVIGDWARRYAPIFGLEVNVDELVKSVTAAYTGAVR
ncbi:Methane/Phenol/Toluene Hydroxylase (plasmid) [Mycolicibacterium chubuense NBB4]|uniref:propane 2-monooxygenase n=2 Tax=Mycolicibacterium TaxID=1866885 RepID=D2K2C9_MYCCN|nr:MULTISPECIES: toluene hydroxylase [Mycolicibacterium]ACZ56335.1 putative soluble di-iron monooxygenase beta subunit [Mycolicibacterium chubuense NBB4]AFM20509.1 Methane/Phenol/Toluene Hydroxylase [Mycolicibacterium chubuense NBB4]NTY63977.1 class 7 soluble di-iron monooxygenase beta subunit [Mycolicibacterium sphagni]